MTNKTITLACPFCGGEPKVTRTSGDERDGYALRISYVCKGCGCSRGASGTSAEGGYADNSTVDQRALAAWNTRAALADPVPPAGGAPAPEYFVAACDKFDWTPEEALRFYAEGKHFDVVDGRTRILCTGAIASHALKGIGGEYADMKGMAPAGVEPEVVGYRCRQSETEKWHMSSTPAYWEHQPVILLEEHRAHVTRLQAEVERLEEQACISGKNMLDQWNRANALQAELAKARELLSTHCPNISIGVREFLSNQSAPADKECSHRFMSLADDPRRCADCDAVETHDEPVVRLELVRSGLSEGLHIRVWENLGNLWPGVHMLYLGPAERPAPVAVVMPERKTVKAGLLSESNTHNQGWNACLDEFTRLNSEPKP